MGTLMRGPLIFATDDALVTVTDREGVCVLLTRADFFSALANANLFQKELGAACAATVFPACAICEHRPKH